MNISIKRKIYLTYFLLGFLFALNAAITVFFLYRNNKLGTHISSVIDPSLKQLDDFHDMVIQSRMYSTNWVLLGSNQRDKEALLNIHNATYHRIKNKLEQLSQKWKSKENVDSLQMLFSRFERLLSAQEKIMALLPASKDYDNPLIRSEAGEIINTEIFPLTDAVIATLSAVTEKEQQLRSEEVGILEKISRQFGALILILGAIIMIIGFVLSKYFISIIVKPVNQIQQIVHGLGKGIINKIEVPNKHDEIGKMISAVNHLSSQLEYTANFAQQVGQRHFDAPFQPLSEEDKLGKALITMRENLKSVVESLNQAQHIAQLGNFEWNSKTDKVFWSDEMYVIFGKDRASFVPHYDTVIQCVLPEDRDELIRMVDQCMADHKLYFCECRIENQYGTVRTISIQGNVAVDENGAITKWYGIVQDITARKEKEKEIREYNDRVQLLSKATNDAIWDWDLTTSQIWWSENYYRMFGYDSACGTPMIAEWTDKIHPDDRGKVFERLKKVWENQIDSWEDEFRYQLADGHYGTALDRGFVLKNEKGKAVRVIGALQDITERKKAEQKIADSEKRYRQIVETTQEGIWLVNENSEVVFVNKKMCEMLEYPQEEILGKKNHEFKPESEKQKTLEQIERRKKGISETHESVYLSKTGRTVYGFVSTNPIYDDEGNYKGALAMVTDITGRKQQEEMLKRSEVSLEMKNKELERKNRELEQFAYVASHDLQEPLRTTSGFIELLQQQYRGRFDSTADKYLDYIAQSSDRMKVLINDLLEYSRIGRKKELAKIDCNQLLHEILSDLEAAITEAHACIRFDSLPEINGYATEMKQLFQNLISNAIKFRKKDIAPQVKISAKKEKDHWQFYVSDNGIGIDPQHNEKIFVIFQRLHTRNEYQGSGIGLSHCKKIVELHKGKIWVESEPEKGSTFYFTIPENL